MKKIKSLENSKLEIVYQPAPNNLMEITGRFQGIMMFNETDHEFGGFTGS